MVVAIEPVPSQFYEPRAPAEPIVVGNDHESITLAWNPPEPVVGAEPTSFVVEMSTGTSNEDYRDVAVVAPPSVYDDAQGVRHTQRGLCEQCDFRFRVRVLAKRSGASKPSGAVLARTQAFPRNTWSQVHPRTFAQARAGSGRRLVDGPTELVGSGPTPRRGHTAVMVGGFMYMFGGLAEGRRCNMGGGLAVTDEHRAGLAQVDPTRPTSNWCSRGGGATSELWRLDPITMVWTKLHTTGDPPPPPRERHSAAVIDAKLGMYGGKMIIFGGHDGGKGVSKDASREGAVFNDLWEMDPGALQTVVVDGLRGANGTDNATEPPKDIRILDGRNLYVTTVVPTPAHMCVVDVDVEIELDHGCTRDLTLELIGPGPAHQGVRQKGSQERQHSDGHSSAGFDRHVRHSGGAPGNDYQHPAHMRRSRPQSGSPATAVWYSDFDANQKWRHDPHRWNIREQSEADDGQPPFLPADGSYTRGEAVRLFHSHDGTACGCGNGMASTVFDDEAPRSVGESGSGGGNNCCPSPFKGRFRPTESLSVFDGLQARGEWSLRVYDEDANKKEGLLKKWKLKLTLRPCEWAYTWKNLTSSTVGPRPAARYGHATVVIGRSMYMFGGHAAGRFQDLHRLDYGNSSDAYRWLRLDTPNYPPPRAYGRSMLVTPWRLLAYGGYSHSQLSPLIMR